MEHTFNTEKITHHRKFVMLNKITVEIIVSIFKEGEINGNINHFYEDVWEISFDINPELLNISKPTQLGSKLEFLYHLK